MPPANSRRVLITGASRGLGQAMALAFIQSGHLVAGCARSANAATQWRATHPQSHPFHQVDVADPNAVHAWAKELLATWGVPDLLVNNAGFMNHAAPLWLVDDAEFSNVIDVNIKGTANVIRAFLPAMIQRGSGVVVNFSSGKGRSASANFAPYCAAKWAIEGMTRSLAQELPPGMAAIPLNPGAIQTDMLRVSFGERAAQFPLPSEWAKRAVPFLLGLSPIHNGQPLEIP